MALTRLGLNQSINLASNVTGALPVANGGTALTSGFVNGGSLTEADQWRVTTNFNGSANPVSSNWERNDTNFDKIGTGMSESSGTFTFASTGIYLVQYGGVVSYNGNLRYCDYKINGSTDGFSSNTTLLVGTSTSETSQSADVYTSATCQVTYDVTNVSNNKIRFVVDSHQGGATQRCSSTYNYHYATFIRLGDT